MVSPNIYFIYKNSNRRLIFKQVFDIISLAVVKQDDIFFKNIPLV